MTQAFCLYALLLREIKTSEMIKKSHNNVNIKITHRSKKMNK